jgi:rubrerythrin
MEPAKEREEAADALNSLLRGEISAAETYTQALKKVEGTPAAVTLETLRKDHVEAANVLKRHVTARGEKNDTSSGAWGAFAKSVEGTAKLLGNKTALKALKEGEEHGVKSYERVLEKKDIDPTVKAAISPLLARQRGHLPQIDSLVKMS